MKKIIGLAISGLLLLALVAGGTYAYFSDTETSTENTFSAGTLDLVLSDAAPSVGDSETLTWVFDNTVVYPGMTTNGAILTLTNSGSIAGFVDLSSIDVTVVPGTGEAHTAIGPYDLSDKLMVHLFWDTNSNGSWDSGEADIAGTNAAYVAFKTLDTAGAYDTDYSLAAAGTIDLVLKFNWPSTASDNDAQGDVLTFIFTVELDQIAD